VAEKEPSGELRVLERDHHGDERPVGRQCSIA
jgi:hypothetical protein